MHAKLVKRDKMKAMYSKLSLLMADKVNKLLNLGVTFSGPIEIKLSEVEIYSNRSQLENMFGHICNRISVVGTIYIYRVVSCERSYGCYENTLNFKVLINRD